MKGKEEKLSKNSSSRGSQPNQEIWLICIDPNLAICDTCLNYKTFCNEKSNGSSDL